MKLLDDKIGEPQRLACITWRGSVHVEFEWENGNLWLLPSWQVVQIEFLGIIQGKLHLFMTKFTILEEQWCNLLCQVSNA